jgi:hypothetical protein
LLWALKDAPGSQSAPAMKVRSFKEWTSFPLSSVMVNTSSGGPLTPHAKTGTKCTQWVTDGFK